MPAILVAGGIFLIVIGVLMNAAVGGLGNLAIGIGIILLIIGVVLWGYDRLKEN
jgi:hypothetical protein